MSSESLMSLASNCTSYYEVVSDPVNFLLNALL